MKKILLTIILGIFLFSFASAQPHEINTELDVKVICLNNGFCSNASFCTINIEAPNNSLIVNNQNMTNQISFHNYTIIPNQIGDYAITGFCKDGEYSKEVNFKIPVGTSDLEFDTGKSIMYFLGMAVYLVFLIFSVMGISKFGFEKPNAAALQKIMKEKGRGAYYLEILKSNAGAFFTGLSYFFLLIIFRVGNQMGADASIPALKAMFYWGDVVMINLVIPFGVILLIYVVVKIWNTVKEVAKLSLGGIYRNGQR